MLPLLLQLFDSSVPLRGDQCWFHLSPPSFRLITSASPELKKLSAATESLMI